MKDIENKTKLSEKNVYTESIKKLENFKNNIKKSTDKDSLISSYVELFKWTMIGELYQINSKNSMNMIAIKNQIWAKKIEISNWLTEDKKEMLENKNAFIRSIETAKIEISKNIDTIISEINKLIDRVNYAKSISKKYTAEILESQV